MPLLPFNVAKRRRLSKSKRQERRKNNRESIGECTPLLMAAKIGIVELVEKFIDVNPSATFHVKLPLLVSMKVRRMVPKHYNMHCDDIDGRTADDILESEHNGMLIEAQKYMLYLLRPTLLPMELKMVHQYSFILMFFSFTFMDVMALATSLTSVVVFLSILTSPYELWDFHKSLPRKLNLGFALLFLSLLTTILAFSGTMLSTIRLEWKN
ncbi:hypothetical protein GmHk_16G046048 [Glycine max]|nr:hypothetical protein GmHk_16G046048 [Glycine max]